MAWVLVAALWVTMANADGPPKPGNKCAVSEVGERQTALWIPAAIGLWLCLRRRERR